MNIEELRKTMVKASDEKLSPIVNEMVHLITMAFEQGINTGLEFYDKFSKECIDPSSKPKKS